MENRNYYTLTLSLLGAVKLVLNSFGINIITDHMANDLANAIATIITIVGVIMTHLKNRPKINFKAFVAGLFKKKAPKDISGTTTNQPAQVAPVSKTVQSTAPSESTQMNSPVSTPSVDQKEEPEPSAPAATENAVQK